MIALRKRIDAVERQSAGILLVLFTLLLLVPSANYLIFSGLPLSALPEYLALVILLPLIFSRGLRRIYYHFLRGRWRLYGRVLILGGLIALAAKVVLLSVGTFEGFLACYTTPLGPPAVGECEKSYDYPFFRFDVTRIDQTIEFDGDDWNLSFFNSNRFNYYPWEEGVLSRHRLPLQAEWRGLLDMPSASQAEIEYVGEAKVDLGQGLVSLPPSYKSSSLVMLPLSAGRQNVSIEFYFDDGYRTKQPEPPGPYALLKIRLLVDGQDGTAHVPLEASRPPLSWLTLAYFVDMVMLAFFLGLLAFYCKYVRADWWVLALTAVLGAAVFYYLPDSRWLPKTRGILSLSGGIFLYLLARRKRRSLLVSYFSLFYLSLLRSLLHVPDLSAVLLRDGGTDFLTYESLARTILETGSLEGGEAVFYYQPLFRYISFATHILFGDGDAFAAILALSALNFGVLWLFARLYPRGRIAPWKLAIPAMTGLMLIALLNSWHVVYFLHIGASEYPSWILLPYIVYLLFITNQPKDWQLGSFLMGISILTRPNHGLALLALFAIFQASVFLKDRKLAVPSALILMGMGLLPLLHNLYYGHEVVFLPRSFGVPENLVLPPKVLLTEFGDPAIRLKAWQQFEWLFYLRSGETQFIGLSIALHGLQVLWLLSLGRAWIKRRSLNWTAKIMLLIPFLFLVVQYFYVLNAVYPRHIIMGHFAMGIVVAYAFSTGTPATLRGHRFRAGI